MEKFINSTKYQIVVNVVELSGAVCAGDVWHLSALAGISLSDFLPQIYTFVIFLSTKQIFIFIRTTWNYIELHT